MWGRRLGSSLSYLFVTASSGPKVGWLNWVLELSFVTFNIYYKHSGNSFQRSQEIHSIKLNGNRIACKSHFTRHADGTNSVDSLIIHPYLPLLLLSFLNTIQCLWKFKLAIQHCRSSALCPSLLDQDMSSFLMLVNLIGRFVTWEVSGHMSNILQEF